MLYSEFLKGTRAPETPDTYDQFQIIGQIYEDCEGMTKEEAYRIWKQTYGRELKRRELRQRERLELLINREDYDSADHTGQLSTTNLVPFSERHITIKTVAGAALPRKGAVLQTYTVLPGYCDTTEDTRTGTRSLSYAL